MFVSEATAKEAPRSPQEYVSPLLVMTGEEYKRIGFDELYRKISDALRGDKPRVLAEIGQADGSIRVLFEDNSSINVPSSR